MWFNINMKAQSNSTRRMLDQVEDERHLNQDHGVSWEKLSSLKNFVQRSKLHSQKHLEETQ